VYNNLRNLIIGKMYSSADLAYYNQGDKFPKIIVTNINTSIDSVLLPTMSNEQDDRNRIKSMTRRAIKTSTYVMAPLMMGLAFCAESIVKIVLTDKWLPCVPFLRLFCIEGGAVCFKEKQLGQKLYELKNFGIHGPEEVPAVGANAKMNEFCAAMGICNLRHVNDEIAKRKAVVERYRERLSGVDGIQLNCIQDDVKSNYAYFPVVFEERLFGASRAEVFDKLAENGIGARKYFYPLTNTFECFHGKYDVTKTPVALHISKRVLTLPLYADLALDDVDRICDIILNCKY